MAGSRNHAALNQRRWKRVRREVLTRDNWTCQTCGRYGNECDHRTALQNGGKAFDLGNLQILCRGCHISKTRAENTRPESTAVEAWRALVEERMAESVV